MIPQYSVSKQCEHEQHLVCRTVVRDELGVRTWACSCRCHSRYCAICKTPHGAEVEHES